MRSIDPDWTYLSHRAFILENRMLRVIVLPELGGRIWSMVYKPLDREVLWHNPRIRPQRVTFGAGFDNVWCGGWEEMFPTAAPGVIRGEAFPDHGEVWCLPWTATAEEEPNSTTLRLSCQTPMSAVSMEKSFALVSEEARLLVTYTIRNLAGTELPFLFALHPALAAGEGHRIDFPPMSVNLESTYLGTLAGATSPFSWPVADRQGESVDLRTVSPASSGEVYFLYGCGYREGWCALTDPAARFTAGFTFEPEVLSSCWVFATYGGWRGYHTVLLEPCTSHLQQIETAIAQDQAARLPPGAVWQTAVTFLAQEGLRSVGGLSPDGRFREG